MLIDPNEPELSPGRRLRDAMAAETLALPGVFNAAVALLAERSGFPALYVSGAGLANGVGGYPDIGLLTMTEVVEAAGRIAEAVAVPVIADADTGFGEPLSVRRTVQAFERAGVAGIHIEDQENPKRCGHLAGKRVVAPEEMVRKVAAAVSARRDPDFVIIARVDSRAIHGLDDAIARAQRYRDAGADVIFPEGLESEGEFARMAEQVGGPLLANMTEFGKSPLLSVEQLGAMGYRLVIFPMTAFRIAMKAVEAAFAELRREGTQAGFVDRMQTRQELYELVRYRDYAQLDDQIAGYE